MPNIITIKEFQIITKNQRTEISYTHRADRHIIVIERIVTYKEMLAIIDILKFNDNWDMIIYNICDYITDAKLKRK